MRIKDIGIVVTGKTPSTNNLANYSTKDCMFVTPDDILDDTYIVRKTRRYISHAGLQSILSNSIKGISIAVTCIGEVGRCAILHDSCATNQQINSITNIDTKIVEPVALYYWFKCCGKQLINYASQTVMPIVSKSTFENIQIELPDIEHQKALVNMLSHVDDLIENNKNLSNKLSDIVNLTYNYWFIQFDFPDEGGRPYKSSGGKMVYNDQLEQEIPEGWKIAKIKDIATVILGGTPSRDNNAYWNGNISWLNSGEVANFPIIESKEKITADGLDNSSAKLMPEKTIAISITGYIRVSVLGVPACANQSVVGVVDDKYKIGEAYLLRVIDNLVPYFNSKQTGNSQKHINKDIVGESLIVLPPKNILTKFTEIASPILDLIINSAKESKQLASLRDWLLPMLMNGQAEIRERKEASNDQV